MQSLHLWNFSIFQTCLAEDRCIDLLLFTLFYTLKSLRWKVFNPQPALLLRTQNSNFIAYIYIYVCVYVCMYIHIHIWASLVPQMVKNLPATLETRVRSLGREKSPWRRKCQPSWRRKCQYLSSILAWRIPWTGEPGRLQSMGSQRVGHD